jgi:aldose 1-epimerase
MDLQQTSYGKTPEQRPVELFTLTSSSGMKASLTSYGATLVSLHVPDRRGNLGDVTLGYDTLEGWVNDKAYLGATVGRYGNRIAFAKFTLEGKTYRLAPNDGPHHLHGGIRGFNRVVWDAKPFQDNDGVGVTFSYVSPDGEEGYPGTLSASVTYRLTNQNELRIDHTATTDKPTIVNLVNHTYWNLLGDPTRAILDHVLKLNAERYLPVDGEMIPIGEPVSVAGTAMDFTTPVAIGSRIAQVPGGYDHNWVLPAQPGKLHLAAVVRDPGSGRVMELHTDQPGVQFYTGNFLDGSAKGKGGVAYGKHAGFCLETQRWPDSPNHPTYPSAVLRPGEMYKHTMVHQFTTV